MEAAASRADLRKSFAVTHTIIIALAIFIVILTVLSVTGVIPAHEGDAIVLGRSIRSSSGMNYIRCG